MTFSYDPTKIDDHGLNQIRFDLGDIFVKEPEKTTYLSDEEILVALVSSKTFKRAELKLVKSLLFRFSYETNLKIKEAQWWLQDRVEAWGNLYKRLKAEVEEEETGAAFGILTKKQRPPLFTIGQFDFRNR